MRITRINEYLDDFCILAKNHHSNPCRPRERLTKLGEQVNCERSIIDGLVKENFSESHTEARALSRSAFISRSRSLPAVIYFYRYTRVIYLVVDAIFWAETVTSRIKKKNICIQWEKQANITDDTFSPLLYWNVTFAHATHTYVIESRYYEQPLIFTNFKTEKDVCRRKTQFLEKKKNK